MAGWWQRLWGGGSEPEPARTSGGEGGEWQVLQDARLHEARDGQMLEYPGRTAECPRGHRRIIPTRFDRPVVELTCSECGRRYPLRSR